MYENHKFVKLYHKLFKKFYFYFEQLKQGPKVEDIHQLRVSIKKLRAHWTLLHPEIIDKRTRNDLFYIVKDLFDISGKIRTPQIILSLLNNYPNIDWTTYELELQKKIEAHFKDLEIELNQVDLKSLDDFNHFIALNSDLIPDEKVVQIGKSFLYKKWKKVEQLFTHMPETKKMHKIRIQLKAVQEVLRTLIKINANQELKKFNAQIIQINENLGNWHDVIDFEVDLKNYLNQDHISQNYASYKVFLYELNHSISERTALCCSSIENILNTTELRAILETKGF